MCDAFDPGDGADVVAPGEQPGEGQLRRRDAFFIGHALQPPDEFHVGLEIARLEPRRLLALIVIGDIAHRIENAGQKALA